MRSRLPLPGIPERAPRYADLRAIPLRRPARRPIRDLRRRRFDLVIELSGGDRGAIYSFLTGARERIGFAHPRQPFWQRHGCFTRLLPRPPVTMHMVDQNLAAVRALGIMADPADASFLEEAASVPSHRDMVGREAGAALKQIRERK